MFVLQILSEEGPNTELAWLLWGVLGFLFLMIVIGWLASRNKKPDAAPIQTEHSSGH